MDEPAARDRAALRALGLLDALGAEDDLARLWAFVPRRERELPSPGAPRTRRCGPRPRARAGTADPRRIDPAVIEADLDRLEGEQRDDGGWDVDWAHWSPAGGLEWRGWATVRAVRILRAHGAVVRPDRHTWHRPVPRGMIRRVSEETPQAAAPPAAPPQKPIGHRLLLLGGNLVAAVVIYFIAAATIRAGGRTGSATRSNGSITAGIGLGLFYGFVFTFLPLLVLSFALRRRRSWRAAGVAAGRRRSCWRCRTSSRWGSCSAPAAPPTRASGPSTWRGRTSAPPPWPAPCSASLAVVGVRYLWYSRRRHRAARADLRDELRSRDEADRARAAASSTRRPEP